MFVETKGKAASLFRDGRGGLLEAAVESERQGLYAYGRRSREARGGARKGGGRGGRRCCAWPDATGQRLDRTFSAVSSRTRHIREQIIWPRSSLDHGWLPRLDPSLSLLARSFSSAHGRSSPAAAASTLRPRLSRARSGCRPVADLASQVTRPCPYPCVHVFLCVWARAEHSWPNKRALSYYLHIQQTTLKPASWARRPQPAVPAAAPTSSSPRGSPPSTSPPSCSRRPPSSTGYPSRAHRAPAPSAATRGTRP